MTMTTHDTFQAVGEEMPPLKPEEPMRPDRMAPEMPPRVPEEPEMPTNFVHGADGRNATQDAWGGEVVVEPGPALVDVGDSTDTGTAVSGTPVLTSPQDVSRTPTNKRGTMYCHNPGWLRRIPVPPMSATR